MSSGYVADLESALRQAQERTAELEAALKDAITDIGRIAQECRHHYVCGSVPMGLYACIDRAENSTDDYVKALKGGGGE